MLEMIRAEIHKYSKKNHVYPDKMLMSQETMNSIIFKMPSDVLCCKNDDGSIDYKLYGIVMEAVDHVKDGQIVLKP